MSRNSSGTYSLPAGNPVVTGTTITSTWANTTLSDIATALTDSLSRTGQGGMQAGLPLADGTAALPGLAWGTELTSGMYRAGAADYRWVVTTTELLQLTTNLLRLSGTAPVFRINESDAAANNRLWDVIASGEDLNFRVLTDALVATNWLTIARTAGVVDSITFASTALSSNGLITFTKVTGSNLATDPTLILSSTLPSLIFNETDGAANNRYWGFRASSERLTLAAISDDGNTATSILEVDRTGTTVDTANFANGTLQYGGNEVGLKSMLDGSAAAGNITIQQTDNDRLVIYSGSGGHTITLGSLTAGTQCTIINIGTGSCNLVPGSTLTWLNGSGTLATGTRALAVGGAAFLRTSGSSDWRTWGTGLS